MRKTERKEKREKGTDHQLRTRTREGNNSFFVDTNLFCEVISLPSNKRHSNRTSRRKKGGHGGGEGREKERKHSGGVKK